MEIPLRTVHYCNDECPDRPDPECRCAGHDEICEASISIKHYAPDIWAAGPLAVRDIRNASSGEIILLLGGNELVILSDEIIISADPPLEFMTGLIYTSQTGFTRRQLVETIVKAYKLVYSESSATSGHGNIWLEGIKYDPLSGIVSLEIDVSSTQLP